MLVLKSGIRFSRKADSEFISIYLSVRDADVQGRNLRTLLRSPWNSFVAEDNGLTSQKLFARGINTKSRLNYSDMELFKRLSRPLAAIVVMAFASIALWHFIHTNPRQENVAILADGTRIEMLGAASATVDFTTERKWERYIRFHVPPQFTKWMRKPFYSLPTGSSNSVIVYLRVSSTPVRSADPPWRSFVTEDDAGMRWTMNPPSSGVWIDGPGTFAHALILNAYPRRQPWFRLHLLDTKRMPLASFKVKNPVSGPFPSWTASHLPQTQSNDALSLTLTSLVRYKGSLGTDVEPYWNVSALRSNWAGIVPGEISFSDPTGNLASRPPPHEPVWKMNVRMRRQRLADFSATERVSFTNIPVPVSTNFIPIDSVNEAGGVKVDLWLVAPAGELFLTNHSFRGFAPAGNGDGNQMNGASPAPMLVNSWASDRPFILMKVTGLGDQDWFFCNVADDLGRQVSVDNPEWSSSIGDGRIYLCKLAIPLGATSLNAVFWVSRPEYFTFLVNDSDVEGQAPTKTAR